MKALCKLHTGPGSPVRDVADKLRQLGYEVAAEGTEHVYMDLEYEPGWGVLEASDRVRKQLGWDINIICIGNPKP